MPHASIQRDLSIAFVKLVSLVEDFHALISTNVNQVHVTLMQDATTPLVLSHVLATKATQAMGQYVQM